ncbi:hypothetical protein G7Y89_g9685 [Cudoniella acicularis]|uniref:Uncharacterized protein n=1 Tax=Cudoniella acicularis TaxID=354080 RepID=A0A8H4RGZ3_9HELO|nr:hypothetical protein G7Y89_g9685 [Cudoniella acicularis]
MRRRQQPTPSLSSSSDSDRSDNESCFDTGDEQEDTDAKTVPTDVDTDVDGDDEADLPDLEWLAYSDDAHTVPIDVDTDVDGDDEADLAWIAREENAYPPDDGSLLLLDMIEGNFYRYCKYKVFRLVYERAAREKIEGMLNRYMYREAGEEVPLVDEEARQYGDVYRGPRGTPVDQPDDDEVEVPLRPAPYRDQPLWLARYILRKPTFSALKPPLRQHRRDLAPGPKWRALSAPDRVHVRVHEEVSRHKRCIIFNPSLVLSPHVALLGLIFADRAFLAPSLTSAKRISELVIPPGYKQLPLYLKPELANIPVFRKSIRTPYGWEISPDQ